MRKGGKETAAPDLNILSLASFSTYRALAAIRFTPSPAARGKAGMGASRRDVRLAVYEHWMLKIVPLDSEIENFGNTATKERGRYPMRWYAGWWLHASSALSAA